jgi:TfoX/Sxy family transcriptional regulator of competence genes
MGLSSSATIGLVVHRQARGALYPRTPTMPYDEDLANRLRELLADEDAITEKRMFGGLAFLLHGNMSVSASRNGGLLARIDPADTDAALARPHVTLMEMGGRTMDGWITVAPEGLKTKRQLAAWVKRSVAFAKTLPPK